MQTIAVVTAAMTRTEMPEMRCTIVLDRRLARYRRARRRGNRMPNQLFKAR